MNLKYIQILVRLKFLKYCPNMIEFLLAIIHGSKWLIKDQKIYSKFIIKPTILFVYVVGILWIFWNGFHEKRKVKNVTIQLFLVENWVLYIFLKMAVCLNMCFLMLIFCYILIVLLYFYVRNW
jgi:hypothetical protein